MKPSAWRVTRRGRFRWDAWALIPGGPWFWIRDCWTKRGAEREAREFVATME